MEEALSKLGEETELYMEEFPIIAPGQAPVTTFRSNEECLNYRMFLVRKRSARP